MYLEKDEFGTSVPKQNCKIEQKKQARKTKIWRRQNSNQGNLYSIASEDAFKNAKLRGQEPSCC